MRTCLIFSDVYDGQDDVVCTSTSARTQKIVKNYEKYLYFVNHNNNKYIIILFHIFDLKPFYLQYKAQQQHYSISYTMFRSSLFLLLVASVAAFAPQPSFISRRAVVGTALFGVEDKVKEIIVSQLGVDAEKVVPSATFVEDLGADSLDTVELIMAIEEEFDCEIPEDEAANISTVQEVIDFVSKL